MVLETVGTLAFRNLEDAETALGSGLSVLHGPNGAGKTNLLEAIFVGLTGRSPRTRAERETIAFGEPLARVTVSLGPGEGASRERMTMIASISRAEGRSRRVDGRPAQADDDLRRPAVSVFMPDRLALVKGPPAGRRAHLDRVVAALWPARAEARTAYGQALAQRNAMIGRIRHGADPSALAPWDHQLAERAVPLIEVRAAAAAELAEPFSSAAERLGLDGDPRLVYRPRAAEPDAAAIEAELAARRASDLARGFSGFGPHLDEVAIERSGRALRRYGSQGQQRLGLLALLFAERALLQAARLQPPVMLLDDVMSELDPDRRSRLVEALDGGQAVITVTEASQVGLAGRPARLLAIADGVVAGIEER